MSDHPKKEKLYRAHSKVVPEWYLVERDEHFGRIGGITDAVIQTKAWWEEKLSPGWEEFFDLEEVEEVEGN